MMMILIIIIIIIIIEFKILKMWRCRPDFA